MTMNRWLIGGGIAAAAIAGIFFVQQQAKAADLGKDGLGDLEERVAELEATTARKGSRKVTLTVSGYVSHQVLFWDDGTNHNTYIGDGGNMGSRFRFIGDAKISPEMTAGFLYEFGAAENKLGKMTQGAGGDDLGGAIEIRQSVAWLGHKNLGKVKIGYGSTATDDAILVDLGGISAASTPDVAVFNGGFFPATKDGTSAPISWGHALNGGISFDTARRNHVLYESPSLAGFTVAASVAENDFWDVALKFAGEFGDFRLAGIIGHSVDKEGANHLATSFQSFPFDVGISVNSAKVTDTKGSASLMHVPTGLFLNVAAGQRKLGGSTLGADVSVFGFPIPALSGEMALATRDPMFWHVAGGIARNWFGIGKTVAYGEYQEAKDMLAFTDGAANPTGIASSKATMIGAGVVQHIDAAAMEVFLAVKQYKLDATMVDSGVAEAMKSDAFTAIIVGTRIQF